MSGGHFSSRRRYYYLRKIYSGEPVEAIEKLSNLDSSSSNDLSLIPKVDEQKVSNKPHSTDHTIKVVQIQTGGGNEVCDGNDIEESVTSESESSSSSISIDFTNESVRAQDDSKVTSNNSQNCSEEIPRQKEEVQATSEPPRKKAKTFNFHVIE